MGSGVGSIATSGGGGGAGGGGGGSRGAGGTGISGASTGGMSQQDLNQIVSYFVFEFAAFRLTCGGEGSNLKRAAVVIFPAGAPTLNSCPLVSFIPGL